MPLKTRFSATYRKYIVKRAISLSLNQLRHIDFLPKSRAGARPTFDRRSRDRPLPRSRAESFLRERDRENSSFPHPRATCHRAEVNDGYLMNISRIHSKRSMTIRGEYFVERSRVHARATCVCLFSVYFLLAASISPFRLGYTHEYMYLQ